ncbi:hypothetical protein F5Y17DRAFT_446994 [Xylariaceae sp. FL0594]|nr:hypothetical protein F5Y17DRAFT_446994 [Xylariaceae sp. FL0594]
MATDAARTTTPCVRCRENEAELDLRSDAVCRPCYTTFIASKVIKRLEVLQRETRGPRLPTQPQRYLLALSKGPSSTALLHILSENLRRQRERERNKGQRGVKFELVVVYVDPTDSSDSDSVSENNNENENEPFTTLFPSTPIHTIPLSSILSLDSIAWSALPVPVVVAPGEKTKKKRLDSILAQLPSPSARADVLRLLTRHAILAAAAETYECDVVLLGYNTTALAELTLTETAKGRGYGIPWLVNDGVLPLPGSVDHEEEGMAGLKITSGDDGEKKKKTDIPIYSPLREIFRKEILTYLSITPAPTPSSESNRNNTTMTRTETETIADILFPSSSSSSPSPPGTKAVVSHRDISLDEVVSRFFVDVEASYPSVVANVVRTTGKLERPSPSSHPPHISKNSDKSCGLCGVYLDPLGDERWRGEIGEDGNGNAGRLLSADARDGDGDASGKSTTTESTTTSSSNSRLCYGCERSIRG